MGFLTPDAMEMDSRHVYGMIHALMDAGVPSQPGYTGVIADDSMGEHALGDEPTDGEPVGDEPAGGGEPVEFQTLAVWVHQARVDAWDAWAADVEALWVTSHYALDLALLDSDECALAAARGRVDATWAQVLAMRGTLPGLQQPTRTTPWVYLND